MSEIPHPYNAPVGTYELPDVAKLRNRVDGLLRGLQELRAIIGNRERTSCCEEKRFLKFLLAELNRIALANGNKTGDK